MTRATIHREKSTMRTIRYTNDSGRGRAAAVVGAVGALLVMSYAPICLAQGSSQKTFPSARAASRALFQAVQNHDEKAMMAILGAGKECVCSEDEGQDKRDRAQFLQKYQQMHRLVREPDGTTVLYIGAENWPFPIPLVSQNGVWRFDSK